MHFAQVMEIGYGKVPPHCFFVPLMIGYQGCPLAEDTPGRRRRLRHEQSHRPNSRSAEAACSAKAASVKLLTPSWAQTNMISQRPELSQAPLRARARARAPALLPCCNLASRSRTKEQLVDSLCRDDVAGRSSTSVSTVVASRGILYYHIYLRLVHLTAAAARPKRQAVIRYWFSSRSKPPFVVVVGGRYRPAT